MSDSTTAHDRAISMVSALVTATLEGTDNERLRDIAHQGALAVAGPDVDIHELLAVTDRLVMAAVMKDSSLPDLALKKKSVLDWLDGFSKWLFPAKLP